MKDENIKSGTTTVGLIVKDAVILAADKRATMGYFIASKTVEKIVPVANHMALTMAGSVGDAQLLARWLTQEARDYNIRNGHRMPVKAAVNLLSNILISYKFYPFFVQLILAGYDDEPHLYNIDMLGGTTEEKYTATGSGSPIAFGVLETGYSPKLKEEDGVKLAVKSVWAAIQRDTGTGEFIDALSISKKGIRRYSADEIKKMMGVKQNGSKGGA